MKQELAGEMRMGMGTGCQAYLVDDHVDIIVEEELACMAESTGFEGTVG